MMRKLLCAGLLLTFTANAKTFQNSYLQFNLPDNWNCNQEDLAWVCAPTSSIEARQALIVMTAKMAGPEDNLRAFDKHLRKPKTLTTRRSKTASFSRVLSVQRRKLSGLEWVEAVHYGSEVPKFRTTYLATVKDNVAILLSLSADSDHGDRYSKIFANALSTLYVNTAKVIAAQKNQATVQASVIGQPTSVQQPGASVGNEPANNSYAAPAKPFSKRAMPYVLVCLGALVVGLLIRKFV